MPGDRRPVRRSVAGPPEGEQAVLFDLDNTLVLEDLATSRAFATAARGVGPLGVDPDRLAAAAAAEAEERWCGRLGFGWADAIGISAGEALWGSFAGEGAELAALRAEAPRFRRSVWEGALVRCGIADERCAESLSAAFVEARLGDEPLDPDAEAVLDELAAGYRLALVTNGAPAIQRAKLALTDLARRFDAIVVSGEVGVGKPDPLVVRTALERLGVGPARAVMVGDSPERDVAAARAAGVRSVWLDRTAGDRPAIEPDARIRSLRELPALLAGLRLTTASPRDWRGSPTR